MSTLAPQMSEPVEEDKEAGAAAASAEPHAAEPVDAEAGQSEELLAQEIEKSAQIMYANRQQKLYAQTDHFFAYLLVAQWVVCVTVSIVYSPYAWGDVQNQLGGGAYTAIIPGFLFMWVPLYLVLFHPGIALRRPVTSIDRIFSYLQIAQFVVCAIAAILYLPYLLKPVGGVHNHVYDAIILGGLIMPVPLYMAFRHQGKTVTRHVMAVGQILIGVLFIHLCRGRIDSQFHIFGSLAGLGYYRDWRVVITASLVVIADNVFGGMFCPQSVFGATVVDPGRWLEHTWWVAFEDAFLIRAIWLSQREMHQLSKKHSQMQAYNAQIERKVELRTRELAAANAKLKETTTDLSRSNTELQQFAYIAAHDLKEPLRTVMSYTEIIAEDLADKLTPDMQENMTFVLDAVKRMQQLIHDLLAYSRVQTQARPFEVVDLNKVLDRALGDLRFVIEEKNATITRDPLPTVSADPHQMSQLFNNLIANALKFNREETLKIHIGAHKDELWCIFVQDNGIGLDMQHNERIFRMFSRLHAIGEYSGTGIGLAICKRIVERHGGEIWVESEKNVGSTFKFSFPELADKEDA